jgi:hypothetical protein
VEGPVNVSDLTLLVSGNPLAVKAFVASLTKDDFQSLPTIASQLPLVFDRGGRWNTVTGHCVVCGRKLRDEEMRGHITRQGGTYREVGQTFLMQAWGLHCGTLSTFEYLLPPDMSMIGRRSSDGAIAVFRTQRSWWRRLLGIKPSS